MTIPSRRCSRTRSPAPISWCSTSATCSTLLGIGKALAAIQGALPRAVRIVTVADGKVDPAALLGLGVGTEADIENRKTHHDDELDHDHDDFDSFVVALAGDRRSRGDGEAPRRRGRGA